MKNPHNKRPYNVPGLIVQTRQIYQEAQEDHTRSYLRDVMAALYDHPRVNEHNAPR